MAGPAVADTLPLPSNLIDLSSEQGEHLLLDAEARAASWPLWAEFVAAEEPELPAALRSLIMVMNALRVPAPSTPEFEPYKTFSQDNFLNDQDPR